MLFVIKKVLPRQKAKKTPLVGAFFVAINFPVLSCTTCGL
jgi:hypothetical protein